MGFVPQPNLQDYAIALFILNQSRDRLNAFCFLDFERVILAHGDLIETNAKAVQRRGLVGSTASKLECCAKIFDTVALNLALDSAIALY